MVVDLAKIERLEKELGEARVELAKEDAERYRILVREMTEVDRSRILGSLTDRRERLLFGLEAPEVRKGSFYAHRGGRGRPHVSFMREGWFDRAWAQAAYGKDAQG